MSASEIRPARSEDVPVILELIRQLAEYERLAHEVVTSEAELRAHLFGARPAAEVLIAEHAGAPVGFALYFTSFSTFLGKPGLYLEDLFVVPSVRGAGHGLALMAALAKIAIDRDYGRFEWNVLDWNAPAIDFYRKLGAVGMDAWRLQRLTGASLMALAARAG